MVLSYGILASLVGALIIVFVYLYYRSKKKDNMSPESVQNRNTVRDDRRYTDDEISDLVNNINNQYV